MGSQGGIDFILNRRSTREYSSDPVDMGSVELVIQAGLSAPSSKNSQPWYIAVVTGEAKEQLCQWVAENRDHAPTGPGNLLIDEPQARPSDSTAATLRYIRSAPVLLLIFNRAPFSGGRYRLAEAIRTGQPSGYENEYLGLGACMQNMLLAAHALGLGALAAMDIMPAASRIAEEWGIDYDLVIGVLLGKPLQGTVAPRELDVARFVTYRAEVSG